VSEVEETIAEGGVPPVPESETICVEPELPPLSSVKVTEPV
jgi:hypothetical protein